MFEYSSDKIKVYGFLKILYLDESRFECMYRLKKLIVIGNGLKAINLADNSIEIKGLINNISFHYTGEVYD